MALAPKDLLNPANVSSYKYIIDSKSKEELRKYRKGQTTSKYKVKVGMMEVTFEGEEYLGKKRKSGQKYGDGKAQGLLWERNWSGLARA